MKLNTFYVKNLFVKYRGRRGSPAFDGRGGFGKGCIVPIATKNASCLLATRDLSRNGVSIVRGKGRFRSRVSC